MLVSVEAILSTYGFTTRYRHQATHYLQVVHGSQLFAGKRSSHAAAMRKYLKQRKWADSSTRPRPQAGDQQSLTHVPRFLREGVVLVINVQSVEMEFHLKP
jgi:hypothetical protein